MRRHKLDRCSLPLLALSTLACSFILANGSEPVQLDQGNFTTFIDGHISSHGVLMEFYANWCPTCQHFQPDYEKVAAYFNTEPKVKPEVTVARVDCATEAKLCNQFGVGRYPTLKYGLPASFKEKAEVKPEEYQGNRKPKDIVQWIGQQKGVEYNYDPTQVGQASRTSTSVATGGTESGVPLTVAKEVDVVDLEKATVLAFKYALEGSELLKGAESRQAFLDFLGLVAAAHPIDRCREGAGKMQAEIPKLWPAQQIDGPDPAIRDIQICSAEAQQQSWRGCKGSRENTRGYTCGLWLLFHSLSGRVEPQETGGAKWLTAVKGYVQHYFQCSDCAKHFVEMASEKAALAVTTRQDAVLWSWRAHNEVNRRLESLEKSSGEGDPGFPKRQWPPSELCPLCRLPALKKKADVTWNEQEIYRFLLKFYMGTPEPEWVTQKQTQGTQLLSIGGRKSLEGAGGARRQGGRQWLLLLVVGGVVVLAVASWRQRNRGGRRVVSA